MVNIYGHGYVYREVFGSDIFGKDFLKKEDVIVLDDLNFFYRRVEELKCRGRQQGWIILYNISYIRLKNLVFTVWNLSNLCPHGGISTWEKRAFLKDLLGF